MCNSYNQYHATYYFQNTDLCFCILSLEHMFIITQKFKICQGALSAAWGKRSASEWECAEFMQLSKVYRQHLKNAQPARNADLGDWGFAPTSKIGLGSTQTLLAAMKSKHFSKAVVAICRDLNMVIWNVDVIIQQPGTLWWDKSLQGGWFRLRLRVQDSSGSFLFQL